jgi:hypothetical protein
MKLVLFSIEQIGLPFPAVGRLERYLKLSAELRQHRLQRFGLVGDPPGQTLASVIV